MGHLRKMNIDIKEIIKSHLEVVKSLDNDLSLIEQICKKSLSTLKNSGKIILCGNGGSASDSIHISSEIVGKFEKKRKALASISLSTNPSHLTAIGNDFGFDYVFSRQIEAVGKKEDLLIAISTSGNSKNVIKALKYAKEKKITSVGLLGNNGGKCQKYCNYDLIVPHTNTARIQECHIFLGHYIFNEVEKKLLK